MSHCLCSVPKSHYLSGVEHIPPAMRTRLELDLQRVQLWVVKRLRSSVWQIQLALRKEKSARKMEGVCSYSRHSGDVRISEVS